MDNTKDAHDALDELPQTVYEVWTVPDVADSEPRLVLKTKDQAHARACFLGLAAGGARSSLCIQTRTTLKEHRP